MAETASYSPRGHNPVIPPRSGQHPGTLAPELLDVFRSAPLADLSDAVGRLYTMSSGLKPLYRGMRRVAGVAVTVKAEPGDNWAVHGALQLVGPDSVLVIDWRSTTEACGAGVSALLPAIRRGLAGVVIDGAWRDASEVAALDFPVIATGVSSFSPAKERLGEINVPVSCGAVVVHPGDVVVGDSEGVVVVPREFAELVAANLTGHSPISSIDDLQTDDNQEDVQRIAAEYWARFDAAGGLRR